MREVEMENRICIGCGTTFTIKPYQANKYCSHSCYAKARCGVPFSEEHKRKICESLLAGSHWAYDPTKRETTVSKLSAARLGKAPWNRGMSGDEYLSHFNDGKIWNKGLTKSDDNRIAQYAIKLSQSKQGNIPWNKGLTKDDDRIRLGAEKQATRMRERYAAGEIEPTKYWLGRPSWEHPNWRGGISFEPYGIGFNRQLKRTILERDDFACALCFSVVDLCVHHIDYNKRNNERANLLTLCRSCNAKVNFNREHWIIYFSEMTHYE